MWAAVIRMHLCGTWEILRTSSSISTPAEMKKNTYLKGQVSIQADVYLTKYLCFNVSLLGVQFKSLKCPLQDGKCY